MEIFLLFCWFELGINPHLVGPSVSRIYACTGVQTNEIVKTSQSG